MDAPSDKRIRVIQVTHDLGVGGLPRVVETLCKHVDRDRYEMEVFCLRDGGPLADRLEEVGIKTFVMDRPDTLLKADYFAFMRIVKHFRERKPDIVHTHNTEPWVEAGIAALMARVPALIHTDHARDFPDEWRYMFAESVVTKWTKSVIAVSDHGKENLSKYIKVPDHKLHTILNGVDGDEVLPRGDHSGLRERFDIPADAPLIGLGARFSEQKGIEYLIRGMPELLEKHPDAHVVIAGYGELEDFLKGEAERLEVTHRVKFVGKVNSMAEVLSTLDIFALPSIWEGLPMAILEAMAARVPIVATDVGGVGAALDDGKTAVLTEPKNPSAFAQGLDRALSDAEFRKQIAENARATFDAEFSARAMSIEYEKLFDAALGIRR